MSPRYAGKSTRGLQRVQIIRRYSHITSEASKQIDKKCPLSFLPKCGDRRVKILVKIPGSSAQGGVNSLGTGWVTHKERSGRSLRISEEQKLGGIAYL